MPKFIEYNTGPFKGLKFIGHDDAEAYDAQANEVGACVLAADLNDWWRSGLPRLHDECIKILEKLSGVSRNVDPVATAKAKERAADSAKIEEVLEKFVPYANRVKASVEESVWTAIDAAVRTLSATIAADSSPTARAKGPDKGSVAKAQSILTRDDEGIEAAVEKLFSLVPDFNLVRDDDGKPDETSLARLIDAWTEARRTEL
jgi:hypothetical protein